MKTRLAENYLARIKKFTQPGERFLIEDLFSRCGLSETNRNKDRFSYYVRRHPMLKAYFRRTDLHYKTVLGGSRKRLVLIRIDPSKQEDPQ